MARLDGVAGKQRFSLTRYGCKSGKAREVTIWFVVHGERIYVGTTNVTPLWERSVQKTPKERW